MSVLRAILSPDAQMWFIHFECDQTKASLRIHCVIHVNHALWHDPLKGQVEKLWMSKFELGLNMHVTTWSLLHVLRLWLMLVNLSFMASDVVNCRTFMLLVYVWTDISLSLVFNPWCKVSVIWTQALVLWACSFAPWLLCYNITSCNASITGQIILHLAWQPINHIHIS